MGAGHSSSDELFQGTQTYRELMGLAYWYVAYNSRKELSEIWRLDPNRVEVIKSETNFIAGYKYRNGKRGSVSLQPWDVIPFKDFHPTDPYGEMGPVQAAVLPIDIDTYASQ